MSNGNTTTREVAPLTDELIAEGRTIKCTKCHAWIVSKNKRTGKVVTAKYNTRADWKCWTCDGLGYITAERREEVRVKNIFMKRRAALMTEVIPRGIDENVGVDHEDYKVLRGRELMRFVNIALVAEGFDVRPGKDDEHALRVLIERTGWDFLAWLREEAK
jgi:hypothetical protein